MIRINNNRRGCSRGSLRTQVPQYLDSDLMWYLTDQIVYPFEQSSKLFKNLPVFKNSMFPPNKTTLILTQRGCDLVCWLFIVFISPIYYLSKRIVNSVLFSTISNTISVWNLKLIQYQSIKWIWIAAFFFIDN